MMDANLGKIETLHKSTTKGKWCIKTQTADYIAVDRSGTPICAMSELNSAETNTKNAEFIVRAHNEYIPALTEEVHQDRIEITSLKKHDAAAMELIDKLHKERDDLKAQIDMYGGDEGITTALQERDVLAEANKNLKTLYCDARDSNIAYAERNAVLKKALELACRTMWPPETPEKLIQQAQKEKK